MRRLAAGFPILALTGPRQSGKTTLARALFADRPYVSLEDPAERAFAQEDPRGFLARFAAGAVFDEAQRWPDLFSWLQGMVDEVRVPGRFVLTGSQQFGLLAHITQSLAGRVGVAHLLALSVTELSAPPLPPLPPLELDRVLLAGGYPPFTPPKLYFLDAGLAAWLLGIRDPATLALHPLRGALFETLIVSEVLKHRRNAGVPPDLYFWRDNNGLGVDLLIEEGAALQPVEIKSGRTVTPDYIRAAQKAGRILGDAGRLPWLVHGGEEAYERSGVRVVGWRSLGAALAGS